MKAAFVLFACFAAVAAVVALPGVRVDVSETGLNYAAQVALPSVVKQLARAAIPDIRGSTGTPIGTIEYSLTQIAITHVALDGAHVALAAPADAGLSLAGLSLGLKMHWHYKEKSFPHVSDSGSADASTAGASASVTVALGADGASGRPTARVAACSTNLGKFDLKLHGGASWLYNVFVNVFHDQIKKAVDSGVCAALRSNLDSALAQALATVPVQQPIGSGMGIDYALTASPSVVASPARVSIPALGEVYPLSEGPGHSPFVPDAMPLGVSGRYFEALVSQFTFDTMGYAAQKAGVLHKVVTKDMAPASAAIFFSTAFFKPFAPALWALYGNCDVALGVSVDSLPGFLIEEEGFTGLFPVTIAIAPRNATKGAFEEAFAVIASVTAIGSLEVSNNNTLSGELRVLNATTSLKESFVGDVSVEGLGELVDFALGLGLDFVNAFLANGVVLPVIQGVTLTSPSISWHHGFVSIASDFVMQL